MVRRKHTKKNYKQKRYICKSRKYVNKHTRKYKRNIRKTTRKYKKGGGRKCISGGPNMITILTKGNKKIVLIGETHLVKPTTSAGKIQMKKLINKSIDKNCDHFSSIIEKLITMNDHRNFDLFLEISPKHYKGDIHTLGSGGMKIMNEFKQKNLHNLRIHWSDLRSIVKENESVNYSLSKNDLQNIYNIPQNNCYWQVITMLKVYKKKFERMALESELKEKRKTKVQDTDFFRTKGENEQARLIRQDNQSRARNEKRYNELWKTIIKENYLDLDILKTFTIQLMDNSASLKNDFNEIMLSLFYKSGVKKIQKQWPAGNLLKKYKNDKHNIKHIFLNSTWRNYIRTSLITGYENIIDKIINDKVKITDFRDIYNWMKLINTVIFAVLLDFYILGRIMKDYIHNDIIIFTGAAHTRNYIDILTNNFDYSVTYSVKSSNGKTDVLEYDDTELFMYF
jgi:hypothetical protein